MNQMRTLDITKINFEKIAKKMTSYQGKWIAISSDTSIVGSGDTYLKALEEAKKKSKAKIALFKVPPLGYSLSPVTL